MLERKIDELVSLLANRPQESLPAEELRHEPLDLQQPTRPPGIESREPLNLQHPIRPHGIESCEQLHALSFAASSPPQGSTDGTEMTDAEPFDVIERDLLDQWMAQKLLDRFRLEATYHFPFVTISPDADVASVRSRTPFLFLCIVTSMLVDNCPLQRQLGEEIRVQVHRRIMLRSEKSLELLQGLLVHLGWYFYQISPQSQQIILLSQLCVTLIIEMGLDRNPKSLKRRLGASIQPRSPAQLRALLGTYCLVSS